MGWDTPGVSQAQLSQLCPLPVLVVPQPLTDGVRWRAEKGLGSVGALLSNSKNSLMLLILFPHKPKTQPNMSYCAENCVLLRLGHLLSKTNRPEMFPFSEPSQLFTAILNPDVHSIRGTLGRTGTWDRATFLVRWDSTLHLGVFDHGWG